MLWCCIEPKRVDKTTPIMEAMAQGFGGKTCLGDPPDDGELFVIWGQLWTALTAIPRAIEQGRPFLHIDNGYINPGRGSLIGYYRITYNGMAPVFLPNAPKSRIRRTMPPWRTKGAHVLLALPGEEFGRAIGHKMEDWLDTIEVRVRQHTTRKVKVRPRKDKHPLDRDLLNCWALVTHSSNVAVDAVLSGVPVFTEPTNPAAPIANFDLSQIEQPLMPDRTQWFNSLMYQQFTVPEMRSGFAAMAMQEVMAQSESIPKLVSRVA